jgi:hypothetical protein
LNERVRVRVSTSVPVSVPAGPSTGRVQAKNYGYGPGRNSTVPAPLFYMPLVVKYHNNSLIVKCQTLFQPTRNEEDSLEEAYNTICDRFV